MDVFLVGLLLIFRSFKTSLGDLTLLLLQQLGAILFLGPQALGTGIEPSGALGGNELSYVTRRSYLGYAYAQIWNTSPTLVGLLSAATREPGGLDNMMINVQYQAGTVPTYTTFTGNFPAPQRLQMVQPAAYPYALTVCPIPVYFAEQLIQDDQKIQDIIDLRMTDCGNSTRDLWANSLWSTPGSLPANAILPISNLIDDGTNFSTLGTITRSGNVWWQSKRYNVNSSITRLLTLLYIVGVIKQQGEKPDFGVTGPSTWAQLAQDYIPPERYTSPGVSPTYMSGFDAIEVCGVPIYLDPYAPEGSIWLFNTNYITARIHQMADWEMIDFVSMLPNFSLNWIAAVVHAMQIIQTKPRANGVLYNITGTISL
ncbi:MAG TPA: phage major capsid protein [Chthoniobacterales bacterium]|nr:phage major capsid protein [Chthoniobacterales bacterium]